MEYPSPRRVLVMKMNPCAKESGKVTASAAFRSELVALAPRLRRFALSLTNNQADADDLVQHACEKALANAESFRVGTRMDSWLYRIIQNKWISDRRRLATRGREVDAAEAGLSDGGVGARALDASLMLDRVRRAMDELPDAQRAALSLVAIEGLSYREAAETLEIPIGTLMSRLARARSALAPLMRDDPRVH